MPKRRITDYFTNENQNKISLVSDIEPSEAGNRNIEAIDGFSEDTIDVAENLDQADEAETGATRPSQVVDDTVKTKWDSRLRESMTTCTETAVSKKYEAILVAMQAVYFMGKEGIATAKYPKWNFKKVNLDIAAVKPAVEGCLNDAKMAKDGNTYYQKMFKEYTTVVEKHVAFRKQKLGYGNIKETQAECEEQQDFGNDKLEILLKHYGSDQTCGEVVHERKVDPDTCGRHQAQHQNTGNSPLIDACRNGDLIQVKHILSQGTANINTREKYGRTPAMVAVKEGQREILELLVKQGSDLSQLDDDQNSILHLASKEGHLEIVKYIYSMNTIDIESRDFHGNTPIMLAALFGLSGVFVFLVEMGADLSLLDNDAENILHLSCRGGGEEIVKYIIKLNVVDINSKGGGMTPVLLAAAFGNRAAFENLVEMGADLLAVDTLGNSVLHLTCQGGYLDIVKYVLKQNIVDINSRGADGRTPALIAAAYGHSTLFEYLVKRGADLSVEDDYGYNTLHSACRRGNMDIVKHVFKQNIVDINSRRADGGTPALIAAVYGHSTLFEYLVKNGADLSVEDDDGDNILHSACVGGNIDIVKYVLKQNIVDLNTKASDGTTPVSIAAVHGHSAVLEYLVKGGANLSTVNENGDNILHLACQGGDQNTVKYILNLNVVDINSKGNDGYTPVMLATELEDRGVFDLLLERGADVSVENYDSDNVFRMDMITFCGRDQAQRQNTGNSTLIDACRNGDLLQVKHILSQGTANINTRGKYGRTLAMIAAKEGQREILELLVKKGSDLSQLDDDHSNILHLASQERHLEIVKYIHSLNIIDIESRDFHGNTPIMLAALFGQTRVFSFLVQLGADVSLLDDNAENILHLSCRGGDEEIVKYIIKLNVVDINSKQHRDMTAMLLAVAFGNRAAFEYLVEMGADLLAVDIFGNSVLHFACQGGYMDIVKYVLKQNIGDINTMADDGRTPALIAAVSGHSALFEYLVKRGADLSVVDEDGYNILHLSCEGGNMDIVKYVFKLNVVDINARADEGQTPALIAADFGHSAVLEYIVKRGADLSVVDEDGYNVLHVACEGGDLDTVKYVLNLNVVDINSKGIDGYTPVMLATELEDRDVFDLLIERGADVSVEHYDSDNVFCIDMITFCKMCCHTAWQTYP
ncbi:ankyrin-1-like [Haliotis rubra]|uniref:ankyrin-1-like n=1 Tax=Haliotis rubra TaxID=36100 RepID=UPI001EE60517|nr:ankyrin-1-like [Haliotis rubra]